MGRSQKRLIALYNEAFPADSEEYCKVREQISVSAFGQKLRYDPEYALKAYQLASKVFSCIPEDVDTFLSELGLKKDTDSYVGTNTVNVSIIQRDNYSSIYVNGKVIDNSECHYQWYGNKIGPYIQSGSRVALDNLTVLEKRPHPTTFSGVKSSGTGFALSSNGYIVTNQHVVDGASKVSVRGLKGDFSEVYDAKVIVEDKKNDLAIIKIADQTYLGTPPYRINSSITDVGNAVYALGYPLRATMGDEVKLTNGIISSKTGFQGDITTYQISVPIQPGNSGGPLFDSNGNIIGIINAKHTGAENASYAIKASYLMNLIQVMNTTPRLPQSNTISNKSLSEQVKYLKKFVYIIETE
ncbi:MAG: trypsin-like peptidase domain-containing protein [Ekhidna sp.]|nr:trypsin-like peptidase domain-containing protein [Ekhidna sp.]